MYLPAQAHYEKLMNECSPLFQAAPVNAIASFLGMFLDTLSKLCS